MERPTPALLQILDASYLNIKNTPLFQWATLAAGWLFLTLYIVKNPLTFEPEWVLYALAAYALIPLAYMFPIAATLTGYSKMTGNSKPIDRFLAYSYNPACKFIAPYRFPLIWKLLIICPAEDGLFIVPLLYFGVDGTTAGIAAFLFALLHYPTYQLTACISKGLAFFGLTMLVLPHSGLGPILVAHILIDMAVLPMQKLFWPGAPYKSYYEDGTLREEGFIKKHKREGLIKTYRPSGKLHIEGEFFNGKPNGKYKIFSEDGVLSCEGNMKNGQWHGHIRIYHSNGAVSDEGRQKHGKWHGWATAYKENGEVDYKILYDNGILIRST